MSFFFFLMTRRPPGSTLPDRPLPYTTLFRSNPIHRTLGAKARQLKAAPDDVIRIISLCDGDCAAMRESVFVGTGSSFSARQIATEFLRKTSSIDLVLLVTIEHKNPHKIGRANV